MNYFYLDVCAMKPVRMTTRVWARSQLTNTVSGLDILPFAVGHREATRMLDIYVSAAAFVVRGLAVASMRNISFEE